MAEQEPNEDGSPSVADDFSLAEGPFTETTVLRGAISPIGDEDIFAITNPSLEASATLQVRLELIASGATFLVESLSQV